MGMHHYLVRANPVPNIARWSSRRSAAGPMRSRSLRCSGACRGRLFSWEKRWRNGGNAWVNGKDWLDVFVFPSFIWSIILYNFEILKNSGHAKNNTWWVEETCGWHVGKWQWGSTKNHHADASDRNRCDVNKMTKTIDKNNMSSMRQAFLVWRILLLSRTKELLSRVRFPQLGAYFSAMRIPSDEMISGFIWSHYVIVWMICRFLTDHQNTSTIKIVYDDNFTIWW